MLPHRAGNDRSLHGKKSFTLEIPQYKYDVRINFPLSVFTFPTMPF